MSAATATWKQWLDARDPTIAALLDLPPSVTEQQWNPTEQDRAAAWDLYTELRTRITAQPLHYLYGDEETALASVADLFATSREIIHKAGPQARHFATLTTFALNRVVRPFTAKWHKHKTDGALANEDVRREFRGELIELQPKLQAVATVLGALAEGDDFCEGSQSWPDAVRKPGRPTAADAGVIPFDIAFDADVKAETVAGIRWNEHNEIRRRRGHDALPQTTESKLPPVTSPDRVKDVAGLAISGGGIRSATFALGIVQRLTEADLLREFDYLSTVSGGGYLGSFLSTYLNVDPETSPDVGTSPNQLPFRKPGVGESAPLRHLRGHSKYLLSGGVANRLNMMLLAVFGIVATAIIFWPLLSGALLAIEAGQGDAIRHTVNDAEFSTKNFLSQPALTWSLTVIAVSVLLLAPVTLGLRAMRADQWVFRYQKLTAVVIVVIAAFAAWNLIPLLFRGVDQLLEHHLTSKALPGTATILGAIAALQRFWVNLDSVPAAPKLKHAISYVVMALVGPALAIVLFLWLGDEWIVEDPKASVLGTDRIVLLSWFTFAPFVFALAFIDVNVSSLHPFYRRKLSEGYLFIREKTPDGGDGVRAEDGLKLSELRSKNAHGPYHLINGALNAPSSRNAAVRGRGTDFFLFSQRFCGSPSVGYSATEKWEQKDARLNLGTAMAVSAAAASPFMGVASIPGGNFLLTLFNVRLDYWLARPGPRHLLLPWTWRAGPWYLFRQGFGWMDDRSWYVNVSDGGHIENLAVYELLRRRSRFIVAIDGECDPHIQCGSLMQLIRYAIIDFGITISIDMSRLRQKPDGTVPFHFALAEIEYPELNHDSPKATGYLLYIKLSLTGNEPPHVAYYHSQHAEFPHESTADQFFNEDQFEAYRALGHHAANDLFSSELLGQKTTPDSLKAWFTALSQALEDPKNK